ncbi:hypothetical protein SASPL_125595 [Salvia splendens]|uniref:Uncharacterized protein n=1 Tax=Salvia splendens TaxID=180675 RepID=A0A8X8XFR9_SALSN|nr:uncharacterized protein LOC121748625 [Salvia splendens]XP_041999028.1 uncharacterized protein LOC121748625 [Salvia splendens]KAG6412900.1 hypothetical protein SASPL_125595 [Salvia splendens]
MAKNNKKPRKGKELEGHSAANPLPEVKRFKAIQQAAQFPSTCLVRGFGNIQWGGESLRYEHRTRLFRLLSHLLMHHNWAEASGALSVLIQGTIKDHSLSGNRAKYTAALELLSVIEGENLRSRRIQDIYEVWMKKIGLLRYWHTKHRFSVQLEVILTCLQRGNMRDAYQAALGLKKECDFDGDAVANLVVGLTFCQVWYSGLPEELQLTALDSSGFGLQSEILIDKIHMPIEYSEVDSPHEAGDNSNIHCGSISSVANDKEVGECDSNKNPMDTETKEKKETSCSSYELQNSREESAEPNGISGSSFSDCSGDLPQASIFLTQGLPPWLLPLKLPISHENLEDAVRMHRNLLNEDYKNAVKHLRVALHTTPPAIEALHPFIQMLILGDQVHEALDELGTLFQNSETVLQLRLQASLLEHFDSGNYVKLCTYFEDILKKDPTCNDSLSRLVLMHQRGDYDTQSLVEMLALHLDASYGTCDTWQELASCLLKLSQCEGDRESVCNSGNDSDNRGCLDDSNRVPELFTCGESGKSWRLRCRWWLNRHFHDRILMSEIASGDLKLLSFKAAAASHIYGRQFKYVVKTTKTVEKQDDVELYSFLQTHLLNSVGFCTVKGRS